MAKARLPYRPCVGITLVNPQGLILAGQRLDSETPAWQMPQGGLDPGEDPRAGALRELREETGLAPDRVEVADETPGWLHYDLPDPLIGKVWGGRYRGQAQRWFLMRFLGRDEDIVIAGPEAEFSDWRWIGADELLDGIVPFKRDIYRQVLTRFAPHLR